jgi:hypothetical protein
MDCLFRQPEKGDEIRILTFLTLAQNCHCGGRDMCLRQGSMRIVWRVMHDHFDQIGNIEPEEGGQGHDHDQAQVKGAAGVIKPRRV